MLVNTGGAAGTADSYAHRRGVHAVHCSRTHAVTLSDDVLVAWSLDPSTRRPSEVQKVACPLNSPPPAHGVRILRDGRTVLPIGGYHENALPLLDLHAGLATATSLHFRGGTAHDAIELPAFGSGAAHAAHAAHADDAPGLLVAINRNRAFVYDRRVAEPCARVPLAGMDALACLAGHTVGVPPSLLAACGTSVSVLDVRKLPPDSKESKKVPPEAALATLQCPESSQASPISSLAAHGSTVVAGHADGVVSVWDVAKGEGVESAL